MLTTDVESKPRLMGFGTKHTERLGSLGHLWGTARRLWPGYLKKQVLSHLLPPIFRLLVLLQQLEYGGRHQRVQLGADAKPGR